MNVRIAPSEAALLAAASLVVAPKPEALPAGILGGCAACGLSVTSHFSAGKWMGCIAATPDTIFVFMPVLRRGDEVIVGATGLTQEGPAVQGATGAPVSLETVLEGNGQAGDAAPIRTRPGHVVYRSLLHHKANPANKGLTDTRLKVMMALQRAGKPGLGAAALGKAAKLPHGSVQSTLAWLRLNKFVLQQEVK